MTGKHVPMKDVDIEDMYNASPLLHTLTEPPKKDNFPLFGEFYVTKMHIETKLY